MEFSAAALKDLSKESILHSLTHDDGIPETIARGIVDDLISDDSDLLIAMIVILGIAMMATLIAMMTLVWELTHYLC
jgi:hypothetical protein